MVMHTLHGWFSYVFHDVVCPGFHQIHSRCAPSARMLTQEDSGYGERWNTLHGEETELRWSKKTIGHNNLRKQNLDNSKSFNSRISQKGNSVRLGMQSL